MSVEEAAGLDEQSTEAGHEVWKGYPWLQGIDQVSS
jgi:hypothetical protein